MNLVSNLKFTSILPKLYRLVAPTGAMAFLTIVLLSTSTITRAQVGSVVEIGSGTLAHDRVNHPRWVRVNFAPVVSGTHTIRVAWDSDDDVRFNVRQPGGIRLSETIRGSSPLVWSGELVADERYFLGVWTVTGRPNFTATLESEELVVGEPVEDPVEPVVEAPTLEITAQPAALLVAAEEFGEFSVIAVGGSGSLNYQWLANGTAIPGATSNTLTVRATDAVDGTAYSVEITDSAGTSVFSDSATLSIVVASPEITLQPVDVTVEEGENATFVVTARGEGTNRYQWFVNGTAISGATSRILTIESASLAIDNTSYTAQVTSGNSAPVTTDTATLTVIAPTPPVTTEPDDEESSVTVADLGQGILDSDRELGPSIVRIEFDSLATALHTIRVSWDSDADVRFNVFNDNGDRINSSTVRGSNPGVWSGELDGNSRYSISLWSRSGIANYTATIEATLPTTNFAAVTVDNEPQPGEGLYSLEADTSTWILEGPSPTLDFGNRENSAWGQVLLRIDDLLLVGGDFQGVKRNPNTAVTDRPFLAAFDAVSGRPVTTFQVPRQVNGVVRALVLSPDGDRLYIGGDFGLLAVDPATGDLDFEVSMSDGNDDGRVFDIAVTNTQVYIGGDFTSVENRSRGNLARLSLDGELDNSWTPRAVSGFGTGRTAPVQSVTVSASGEAVYVGGFYSEIDDTDTAKTVHNRHISMLVLNASDASVRPERFIIDVGNDTRVLGVRDIVVTDEFVIIGWGGPNFLSFHTLDGDLLHQYVAESDVQRLVVAGNHLYVGHHGEFFGPRTNPIPVEAVVSIDPKVFIPFKFHSFRLDDPNFPVEQIWRIDGTFGVWGISVADDYLWISGQISLAGSNERVVDGLVRFSAIGD